MQPQAPFNSALGNPTTQNPLFMADPVAYNPNLHVRQEGVLPQFTQVH